MCGNKHKYDVGYEQSHSRQSGKPWHMSWLPFAILLFFLFSSHSWGFVFQPWMWFLLPIAGVLISSFFAKTRGSLMLNTGIPAQEIPQQVERPYVQPYQPISYRNPVQETYAEGSQNFQYQQPPQYDEPYVDYSQPMSPIE